MHSCSGRGRDFEGHGGLEQEKKMYKTELDWVSAYKKLEAELENKNAQIAELETQVENLSKVVRQQLAKAKDLLLRVIDLKNKPCASGHSVNMLLYDNICTEAEQFLEEVSE
jgi:uncharacterized protein YajQ (UPF0234 family)